MRSEGITGRFFTKSRDYWYALFRVIIGVTFLLHGLAKFGIFGKAPVTLMSLFGLAGMIEIIIGALLILGLWTRIIATIGAIEMIVAWLMAHAPAGWNPLSNGGEPAILFFAAFLALAAYGGGRFTIENVIHGKETF